MLKALKDIFVKISMIANLFFNIIILGTVFYGIYTDKLLINAGLIVCVILSIFGSIFAISYYSKFKKSNW